MELTMKDEQRHNIIQKLIRKELLEEEARKMIGLKSCRQVRRIKRRVIEEGIKGLIHKSRGQPSNKKYSEDFMNKVLEIIKTKYPDFRPTLATEKLYENHDLIISHETVRKLMIKEDLWKPRKRRNAKKHFWRKRKDNYGEMQQFDGSYHLWFEDRNEEACLLVAIDDATGDITKAKFDKNEGTKSVFKFWCEYYKENGIPVSIYLDRFGTYKINHPAAEDNKDLKTQFQRACNQTGVKLITAYSPEAKGRVERVNQTLQDRLVKEMRLAGISTIEDGNKFLVKYLPIINSKFSVVPSNKADLHKILPNELDLEQIYSIQSERIVQSDYTILFKGKYFQLNEVQPTTVFKKDTVTVEEHLDEKIKIRHKNTYLTYTELPERPKKQNVKLCALTRKKTKWSPPKGHPWKRHNFTINQKETVSVGV